MPFNTYPSRLVTNGFYKFKETTSTQSLVEYKADLLQSTQKEVIVINLDFLYSDRFQEPISLLPHELVNKIVFVSKAGSLANTDSDLGTPAVNIEWELIGRARLDELVVEANQSNVDDVRSRIARLNAMGPGLLDKIKEDPKNQLPTGEDAWEEETID